MNRSPIPPGQPLAIASFWDSECRKVFGILELEVLGQLKGLDVGRPVRIEGFPEQRVVLFPDILDLVNSHELHPSHPVIRPLFLELEGFGSCNSFPTQAHNTRRGNANLHEILEELIERVIRIATDGYLAVCLVVEYLGQKRSDEGFTVPYHPEIQHRGRSMSERINSPGGPWIEGTFWVSPVVRKAGRGEVRPKFATGTQLGGSNDIGFIERGRLSGTVFVPEK